MKICPVKVGWYSLVSCAVGGREEGLQAQINLDFFLFQFLCMKNIGIFLQTCEKKFYLSKDELFEPENLFEFSNFKKVSAFQNFKKGSRLS